MFPRTLLRPLIAAGLILLMAGAFAVRQESILQSRIHSIDEIVYFRMAMQVRKGWQHYHTMPYGRELADRGRDLPDYFFRPLYKHPPLFTAVNSLSYRIFAPNRMWPFYASLACGLLMIPLIYLIGARIFNRAVGFAAAVVMSLDPIGVMVSQKMWMDSMLGLLAVTALYVYAKAITARRNSDFIVAGIFSGLGALTKYTGAIGTVVLFVYALVLDRGLFRNKYFVVSLFLPLVMLLPWIAWNVRVYGTGYTPWQGHLMVNSPHFAILLRTLLILLITGAVALYFYLRYRSLVSLDEEFMLKLRWVLGITTALALFPAIIKSFNLTHLPAVGWSGAPFYGSSRGFYFVRLLEWNLINFFALLAFFVPKSAWRPGEKLLRTGFMVVLAIFTVWGAFQSRYIIAAVPLGILIGANFLYEMWQKTEALESLPARVAGRSAIIVIVFMITARMMFINQFISYTNDMCYF
ncbi:MAG: glycosyltransferase family 39 protein [Candidatus Omnitrophica bacterium]|nr:glycosyltransferase family 39 protein [Candidatus Omnitrophota bacterium]MCB9721743.1 glycosyltransferase family 39 protein [Candidatus Omnitrophota bacterium]